MWLLERFYRLINVDRANASTITNQAAILHRPTANSIIRLSRRLASLRLQSHHRPRMGQGPCGHGQPN